MNQGAPLKLRLGGDLELPPSLRKPGRCFGSAKQKSSIEEPCHMISTNFSLPPLRQLMNRRLALTMCRCANRIRLRVRMFRCVSRILPNQIRF